MNAAHLLDGLRAAGAAADDRVRGVAIGIVTNNRDPEGMNRVKLRFPWLGADDESQWARVAAPMAGQILGDLGAEVDVLEVHLGPGHL